jgi:hypothetical protein
MRIFIFSYFHCKHLFFTAVTHIFLIDTDVLFSSKIGYYSHFKRGISICNAKNKKYNKQKIQGVFYKYRICFHRVI